MMKRVVTAVMIFMGLFTQACSTPDPDDWSKFLTAVGGLSAAARTKIVRYAMNRRALDFVASRDTNERVGYVECQDEDGNWFEAGQLLIGDVLVCLANPSHVYAECTKQILQELANQLPQMPEAQEKWGTFTKCEPHIGVFFGDLVDDELLDPAAWDNDELARAVLALPAPPGGGGDPGLAAAMAELTAAVRVLAPALCALDADHWACDQQSTGATTGGDLP